MGITILNKVRPIFSLNAIRLILSVILFFLISAQSQQPCRIISVKDTNLFLTRDSLIISLANVETISINAADALQRKIAQRYFRNIEQKLLNKSFIMEIAGRDDSSAQVHLFRALPAGRQSINKIFLREGWGTLVTNPSGEYLKSYQFEARESASNQRGIHSDLVNAEKGPRAALWLSAALGASTSNPRLLFRTTNRAVHCRLKRLVFYACQERHSYENVFWRFSCYGLGMSMAQRRKETALIMGLAIPEERLKRHVENSLFFKVHQLYHMKQGPGIGLEAIIHLGEDWVYVTIGCQAILGGWKN